MLDIMDGWVPKLLSSYIYRNRIKNFVLDRSVWGYISTYPTPLCPILTHTYFLFIYISSLYTPLLFLYYTPFSSTTQAYLTFYKNLISYIQPLYEFIINLFVFL